MKKILFFAATVAMLFAFCACSDVNEYAPGEGTASRPDVSYADYSGPQREESGQVTFGDNVLSLPGEWHLVSTN